MDTGQLVVNKVYSMSIHPERLYGTELTDVTFKGRVDASLVSVYGIIPSEEHRKVYSTLPDGTPNNANQYSWLVFEDLSGNRIVIGEPWIVDGSVAGGDDIDVWDITDIKGDSETPLRIQRALSSLGIYEYTLKKR